MHPPERVLGWGPCAGVGGDSQWVCWRAEDDGASPSGEYGWTEELREEEGGTLISIPTSHRWVKPVTPSTISSFLL